MGVPANATAMMIKRDIMITGKTHVDPVFVVDVETGAEEGGAESLGMDGRLLTDAEIEGGGIDGRLLTDAGIEGEGMDGRPVTEEFIS